MTKILVIYANSDTVLRKSVGAMLYSFKHHLRDCEVYYHNAIFNRAPLMSVFRKVDFIIFHHSASTVWNRARYKSKVNVWLSCDFGSAKKISLMQDEYKNVDLLRIFINELSIDHVLTLAPPSEWASIYGSKIVNKGILKQYLSGYVESGYSRNKYKNIRDIDIGYRTDWTKMHVKLGRAGLLKRDIACAVDELASEYGLITDIKVGSEYFIRGDNWNAFLRRCRFVIGVPSGSSVLDEDGCIERSLFQALADDSERDEQSLYNEIVSPFEGSLALEVLSPRHFEAIYNGCGQILIESDYNGVLEPWKHYLPLKRDFSNLHELVALVSDEGLRLRMVENCQRDILDSRAFEYFHFVDSVLPGLATPCAMEANTSFWTRMSSWVEAAKGLAVRAHSRLRE